MKKMQRWGLKIIVFIFFILISNGLATSQSLDYRLQKADSLFNAKQYTQSLEHYQFILKGKQYTPAMFLKMAFIQEGLNKIGEALYYLNLYYLTTQDASVLEKMEGLAEKYKLQGYATSDMDLALSVYQEYHLPISLFLTCVILFLMSLSLYLSRKNQKPVASLVIMLFMVIVLAVHINSGERISTAVIAHPNTYVMRGPSSGASVVSILNEGHRVEIVGQQDVWYKVEWNGEMVYVRNNNLLPISL